MSGAEKLKLKLVLEYEREDGVLVVPRRKKTLSVHEMSLSGVADVSKYHGTAADEEVTEHIFKALSVDQEVVNRVTEELVKDLVREAMHGPQQVTV